MIRYAPIGDTNYMYRHGCNNQSHIWGLTENTEYVWELNLLCDGEWTGYIFGSTFTTTEDTINCEATNLVASNITHHSAQVGWDGPSVPSWIRYAPTGDTNHQYKFTHNTIAFLWGLTESTEYTWEINMFCGGGWTGYATGATFTTLEDTIGCTAINLIHISGGYLKTLNIHGS